MSIHIGWQAAFTMLLLVVTGCSTARNDQEPRIRQLESEVQELRSNSNACDRRERSIIRLSN